MGSLPVSDLEGEHEPVAIIGMGCRWAGGCQSPTDLWELLRNNRDGWRQFDEPRFSAKGFHHPNQDRPGSLRTRGGFLVDEDARLFDNAFFGITGREVETLDPSQRKLLEVVYEAFENGGETWDSISGSRTGVYIGNFALDHILIQARDWESPKSYAATGADTSILANRISYIFNLHGPSLAMNTACSSSMYALHMAVTAIRNGDCDGAIVAAANWITDPSMQFVLDKLGALSPTSRCHTFDASADGYARGEGYAALYLKKSSIAVLEKLPIRAMIRGTAINANGRTGGITRPSTTGQEDVIRKAYENAGKLPFAETTFFECHGTGTQAGDPIEVEAIGNVFASSRSDAVDDRLLIGSIKPNLGHTEGASAIASIMKVVLSLEAGEIPPTYGVKNLNPHINFDKAKVHVVRDNPIPWPKGKMRRASINSFGFGGANGHCVIDHVSIVLPGYSKPGIISYPTPLGRSSSTLGRSSSTLTRSKSNSVSVSHKQNGSGDWPFLKFSSKLFNGSNGNGGASNGNGVLFLASHTPITSEPPKKMRADAPTRQLVMLPFSAHSASSLSLNIDALSGTSSRSPLADVAYTLGCKRSRMQQRTFRIVDKSDVVSGLKLEQRVFTSPAQTRNLAYVFTGQGAQWHAMGAELLDYSVFRAAIGYLDQVLDVHPERPSWRIVDVLSDACEPTRIQSPSVSQVVCTAVQIGLVDLLASWGVRPIAVVGHSSGEMAAAYAAGRLTAAEAITAAYFRGQAVSKNKKHGAMLAVGLGVDQVVTYLEGYGDQVQTAALNSPGSITLSGDENAITSLAARLTEDGVFNRVLRTGGIAYHSHHMKALGDEYSAMLVDGGKRIRKLVDRSKRYPAIPWVSSVTPHKTIANDGQVTAAYWRANLESPVRFSEAVTNMMSLRLDGGKTIDALVEIGPHPALKSPLEQILKGIGKLVPYASTLKRSANAMQSMLELAGNLFGLNTEIDMAAVNATDEFHGRSHTWSLSHGCTVVDLPKYQFTYGPVSYYESRVSKEYRLRKVLRHDLLGSKMPGVSKLQPQWRNVLRIKEVPWLSDHRLIPDAVFPAAGFIAMAIEAAMRVYREVPDSLEITGYLLRNLDIKTALRFPEDDAGVEIMFSMTQAEATTAKSPPWLSFAVSSVNRDGSEWTEHCTGTIKVEVAEPEPMEVMSTEMDPRFPDARAWYDKFTEIGIGYGPTFQPLTDIRVDPYRGLAQASVALNPSEGTMEGESDYLIHPASLDGAFQLGLIACYGGQVEKASTAFVPVHLAQMYVKTSGLTGKSAVTVAQGKTQGLRGAYIDLQIMDQGGQVALQVDRLRCISFKESKNSAKDVEAKRAFTSPFTRLAWKPDIRRLNNRQIRQLFPAPAVNKEGAAMLETVDMVCCLVVMDIYERYVRGGSGPQPEGELQHWIEWVKKCGESDERPNMAEARGLSPEERVKLLEELCEKAGDRPEVEAAKRLQENIGDILAGHKTGIDVIVPGGLLTSLYEVGHVISGAFPQLANVMDSLGHANPNMRILEIGAGTGSATRVVMEALAGPNGIKRYRDYTFTDISSGFLTSAQEYMSGYRDVNYAVLDIDKDPLASGFEPVYDVVVACEAIHATASMERTLAHCRRLLKPGGKLVLVESTRMRVLLTLLYGTLTGYWLGAADGRTEGPFMDQATWDAFLRKAGFSGTELVLDDYEDPTTPVIVSTNPKADNSVDKKTDGAAAGKDDAGEAVHLLYGANDNPLLESVAKEFLHRGVTTEMSLIENAPQTVTPGARVVVFLGRQDNLMVSDERTLEAFQHLAKTTESMVWLTSSGIIKGRNVDAAFVVGLMRTVSTENPAARFLSIDIDAENFEVAKDEEHGLACDIVDQEMALYAEGSSSGDETARDRELAWQDGCMWVSRVVPDAGLGVYAEPAKTPAGSGYDMVALGELGPIRAAFETPGILTSLYFRAYAELLRPVPADHIEVKVDAVGLNWKDLGLSSGRFDANGNNLSSEYAGTVSKVGAAVTGLAVGDRVYGIGRGHFGNYTCVPAAFAQKLRSTDVSVEMATMPLVYATAIYAFEYVARLRKGQKVLIQSATGGLGLAAIQVAQSKGAEIYATVSGAEKINFLVDRLGIPAEHIFSSRDPKALARAAAKAGGGVGKSSGFDVILSTAVGGDSLPQSLKALAPMGHLVDVGRLDVLESKGLGLELFQKNAVFSSFDLNLVLDNDPELGAELMQMVNELYQANLITPIRPYTVSDIAELDKTLVRFAKGVHIGKLVVSFQNPKALVKVVKEPPAVSFKPDARYIVTGGLGGLGRAIVRWMADRGARNFMILSRRGVTTAAAKLLVKDMESQGVVIKSVQCDISNRSDVLKVISETPGNPVRGVVHAAMSLTDLTFDKLTFGQWRNGFAAKALGTLHLHEATGSAPLDFFVMITSTESIWAPPTQAAYVAANNFQDYFARYRRRLGLPASTVSYGLVADVGSDFRHTSFGTDDMYVRNKALVISEHQVLAQLEPAFLYSSPDKTLASQWVGMQQDPLSAANLFTCMDPAALAALTGLTTSAPRWYSDARVSLVVRAMHDAQRAATSADPAQESGGGSGKSAVAQLREAFDKAISAGPDNRANTIELVTTGIVKTVADMLFIEVSNVNHSKSVADHGVDSLIAAELRNWFVQALRTNLPMQRLLDANSSIKALAEDIVDKALKG